MVHAQKPNFVFRRNGRVHLNRRGRQFSRLLAAELCASAVVMLDSPCSKVVWRVLATHSIRQFTLHFPSMRHRVPSHFNWIQHDTNWATRESVLDSRLGQRFFPSPKRQDRYFNVNKNPTRCNSMQIFIYWKATLHVSDVTAPIIRSTKNCNSSLRYRS